MEGNTLYTDSELPNLIASGDQRAFAQVYHKFYQRVIFFARRYVPEADAQDITADAFFQLWRRRTDFEHIEGLAKFLFVTTRNKCFDFLKHRQVINNHAEDLAINMNTVAEERDYLEHEVRMHLLDMLQAQVDQLPPKVKEVFLLSFREGLKPAQIAEQLGVSVKTVKNQKLSAIKILKAAVAGKTLEMILLVLVSDTR